jgi:arylsulfotransferase ASST
MVAPASGASTPAETYSFVSAPNLHPPRLQVLVHDPGIPRGEFLTTTPPTTVGATQTWGGPLLLDTRAQPVWFLPGKSPADYLQQASYEGRPVLVTDSGIQNAHVVIFDEHYRKIAAISARPPWTTDRHDAWITGQDIWITVGRLVTGQDLTPYGGPADATVVDEGLQEFQISTGKLIHTWDALNPDGRPNIPLSASQQPASRSWDPYHINSVQALPNGDLLVSMRNTSAVYLIDPQTNRVIWTLGGRYSSFKVGGGAAFAWQHDARLMNPAQGGYGQNVKLTLFNNNASGSTENPSAGMVLSLNTISRQARLVRADHHDPPLSAAVMGSMQVLPNGNALVGWGSEPYFSEYSPSGHPLLDVRWPGADASYRALFTNTWIGTPHYPPSGAARGSTVYASWNGATEVSRWEVLAGPSAQHLRVVATHSRAGFETAVNLTRTYRVYEVRALGGSGRVLGTSRPFS